MKAEEMLNVLELKFKDRGVRVMDLRGEPWFSAKDVCGGLGLVNVSEALRGLESREIDAITFPDSTGRYQKQKIISRQGVWRLALRSNKKEAKGFQDWLLYDVMPALHKTGSYTVPGTLPPPKPAPKPTPITSIEAKRLELATAKEQRLVVKEQRLLAKEERQAQAAERSDRLLRARAIFSAVDDMGATGRVSDEQLAAHTLKASEILAGIPLDGLLPVAPDVGPHATATQLADRLSRPLGDVTEALLSLGLAPDGLSPSGATYGPEKTLAVLQELCTHRAGMAALITPVPPRKK